MIKKIQNIKDVMDTTSEISKLWKFSPKPDAMFRKLKKEMFSETSGFRTLCLIRWIVRVSSMKSVLDNWSVFQELWEECWETNLEREIKERIIGLKYKMILFDYFFGVRLGYLLLNHSDNLSRTLQHSQMSVGECQTVAHLTT